jgi:metal-responsive CopG/Arc/MetJ family transcriptional regulator
MSGMHDINNQYLTVEIPIEMVARLDRTARGAGLSRSAYVRALVNESTRSVELTSDEIYAIAEKVRANETARAKKRKRKT